ncbi:MAG: hypothetical protein PVG22_15170 [Chromatiales bacterium]|jgi:hypothetical protein
MGGIMNAIGFAEQRQQQDAGDNRQSDQSHSPKNDSVETHADFQEKSLEES